MEGPGRGTARPGLEHRYPDLVGCHGLRTIGDALTLYAQLQQQEAAWAQLPEGERRTRLAVDRQWRQHTEGRLQPRTPAARDLCGWGQKLRLSSRLQQLLQDIPSEWRAAAEAFRSNREQGGEGEAPTERDALLVLLPRLGWQVPGMGRLGKMGLRRLTVRLATVLQLTEVAAARSEQHAAFVEAALEAPLHPPAKEAALKHLQGALNRLWGVRWENQRKETFWRLTVDGVPLLGNSHIRGLAPEVCGCGGFGGPEDLGRHPRQHHFWECPVARAVVGSVQEGWPAGEGIRREQMWLVRAPSGAQQCVWEVVALAALEAMEVGRQFMHARMRELRGSAAVPQWQSLASQASRRAVASMWAHLRAFAALGVPRTGWDGVDADHPWLRVVDGRLMCNWPDAHNTN